MDVSATGAPAVKQVSPFTRPSSPSSGHEAPNPDDADPSVLADAISRYHYYCDFGISDEHIAPPEQIWAEHALSLVPPAPPRGVSDEYYDILIENSMREMEREYYSSVKRSIVDHVLFNPTERIRLNLELLGGLIKGPGIQKLSMKELPVRCVEASPFRRPARTTLHPPLHRLRNQGCLAACPPLARFQTSLCRSAPLCAGHLAR